MVRWLWYGSGGGRWGITTVFFATGVSLFAIGAHLSFRNVEPQQRRIEARRQFLNQYFKKKFGGEP